MKNKTPEDYGITNYTWNPDGSLSVKGDVYLRDKKLKKLPFKFKNVSGYFDCSWNNLTSLKGAPLKVGRGFYCSCNKLTSLEGAPHIVGGTFDCNANNITSLDGAPQSVSEVFRCSGNNLTSLKGAPLKVGGYFICSNNPRKFTEEEIKEALNSTNTIPFIKSLEEEFFKKRRRDI